MIEKVEMYSAVCDTCKDKLESCEGYTAFSDDSTVEEEISESDWNILKDGKCYCPDCHSTEWDNDKTHLWATSKDGQILGEVD